MYTRFKTLIKKQVLEIKKGNYLQEFGKAINIRVKLETMLYK